MKRLLMFLSFLAVAITSIAQIPIEVDDEKKKKKTGLALEIFGGFNSANLTGDNSDQNRSLPGGNVGGGIQVLNFTEDLGLRSELIYSQQGDKYSYGEGNYGGEIKSRMNYLNLPVIVSFRHKSGFFAEAGLQPGLLVSAKEKRTSSGPGNTGPSTTDIKDDLNNFDLGVPVGAGYVYKKKVGVCARVTPGLLNVNKKEGNYSGLKERNFVISLRASYLL